MNLEAGSSQRTRANIGGSSAREVATNSYPTTNTNYSIPPLKAKGNVVHQTGNGNIDNRNQGIGYLSGNGNTILIGQSDNIGSGCTRFYQKNKKLIKITFLVLSVVTILAVGIPVGLYKHPAKECRSDSHCTNPETPVCFNNRCEVCFFYSGKMVNFDSSKDPTFVGLFKSEYECANATINNKQLTGVAAVNYGYGFDKNQSDSCYIFTKPNCGDDCAIKMMTKGDYAVSCLFKDANIRKEGENCGFGDDGEDTYFCGDCGQGLKCKPNPENKHFGCGICQ